MDETPRRRSRRPDDDEDDRPRRRSRPTDEGEEDRPRRRPVSDEDDDDRPRKRKRDEDEEDRPRKRKGDEEEERPSKQADVYATKDDMDEPPLPRRRSARDEDEPPPRRRRYEEDEDEPRPRRQSSADDIDRRAKMLMWGAVGVLVVIGLVGGGIWYAMYRAKRAPFRAQMATYLAQPTGTAPANTPVGKFVVVDTKDKDIDSMHFDLPDNMRAATPADVTTVVWLAWDKRQVGKYTSGGTAYQWFCEVTVIDLKSKAKIAGSNFSGTAPPQSFRGKSGESRTGDKPTEAVLNYLKGLPRR
jgi:hypothetical protein